MLYVPPISDYRPFYIQFDGGNAIDIKDTFKVIVKTHDYPMSMKVKDPYKNQWYDEHGDDEYIGQDGLFVEAFTFKMECVMFAKAGSTDVAIEELRAGISAFQRKLLSGSFKTYDSWTGFGFRSVRLSEFPMPGTGAYDVKSGMTRVIFTVTLKVNDPVTHMTLSNGKIVEG